MRVTLTGLDGQDYPLGVDADERLRDVAMREHVPGILGECGGFAMCGTCHVYVDEDDFDQLGERSTREQEVLEDSLTEYRATSRLSCQLHGRDLPDGMHAQVADSSWYL